MTDEENRPEEQQKKGALDHANDAYRQAGRIRDASRTFRSLGRFRNKNLQRGRGPSHDSEQKEGEESKKEEEKKKGFSPTSLLGLDKDSLERKLAKEALKKLATIVPWPVWAAIAGVVIFIIIYMLFFHGGINLPLGGGSTEEPPSPNQNESGLPPIPGLSLSLNGPEAINNGELLRYTLSFSYNESEGKIPPDEIILFDDLPANTTLESATPPYTQNGNSVEWKLSDILNLSPISITLRPDKNDFFVTNKISARATGVTTGINLISDVCTKSSSEGGYCSVDYLKSFFGGDTTKATIASTICMLESGGDPFAINTNCDTNDYSVGLFQINLVAHCDGAYGAGKWGSQSCDNPLDENKRLACSQQMKDIAQNIQKAASLSQNGKDWTAWSTWPKAQGELSACNNSISI